MPSLRDSFLSYFDHKGHLICASTPLVPQGDASLLFNSAGMVPFKPYFLGHKKGIGKATSCQKCFRTTDIERVGTTLRHLTFFEMLGNFSFGNYFKDEAIAYAWDYLTHVAGLDPARLYPTVFTDDAEAEELWRKQGPKNPVVRLGTESNFWAMGPTGPCGPCSEIYYDLGEEFGCRKSSCAVGCDCDRYLEIWNLVFMQFERLAEGTLKPLPSKNIDTGMGLERLSMVVEGKKSPFETELFWPIIEAAQPLLGAPYKNSDEKVEAEIRLGYRVIADHVRACVMLASEGLIPSNVERGYVLRRLIRRASRYGRLLGAKEPFLHKLVPAVLSVFRASYPELEQAREQVEQTLAAEEQRFLETLEKGERELDGLLSGNPSSLPGEAAFKLYDTFGFPLELTQEICRRRGVGVDEAGFLRAQEAAAEAARMGWKGSGERSRTVYEQVAAQNPGMRSDFRGYEKTALKTRVAWIIRHEKKEDGSLLAVADNQELRPGDEGELVLLATPFYPEGGGQVGDQGCLSDDIDPQKKLARVHDTQKPLPHLIVHKVTALKTLRPNMPVWAQVDADLRRTTAYHHTATHLLNEALRRVLGPSVRQAGSLVAPDRLRFDFTWPKALTKEQLAAVEREVGEAIRLDFPVEPRELPASEMGALKPVTLLGESYGDKPRFLLIAPKGWDAPLERFSLELCGGTHVRRTGEIGTFKILRESSVAAGIRRVEAVAGPALEQLELLEKDKLHAALQEGLARRQALVQEFQALSGAPPSGLSALPVQSPRADLAELRAALAHMKEAERGLKADVDRLKREQLSRQAKAGQVVLQLGTLRLAVQKFSQAELQTLRSISDQVKRELGSGVVFLGSVEDDKLSFVVNVTQDLLPKGVDASRIAREVAALQKGKGGGRPDFAQGGGPDADWDALVGKVKEMLSAATRGQS